MEESENRVPATEKELVVSVIDASLRLEVTDLLLGQPRDVRVGRLMSGMPSEQRSVVEQIEAALKTYRSYFYPLWTANEVVYVPCALDWPSRGHTRGSRDPRAAKEES